MALLRDRRGLCRHGADPGQTGDARHRSVLATALRSVVMMLFMLAACSLKNQWAGVSRLSGIAMLMIALSGLAGAASWLCGFEALSMADASKVAPIDKLSVPLAALLAVVFLKERPSALNWTGIVLIAVGAYMAARKVHP